MTTRHEHEHGHEHIHATEITPPDTKTNIAAAARTLVATAERLGPRITDHAPGCPAGANGPCTCGSADFLAAMHALAAALGTLQPQNGA